MSKKGRPRKSAARYASGRLKVQTAAERQRETERAERRVVSVVLAQPHRRGDTSQACESPLGRLCLKFKLRPEIYDAGLAFGARYRLWEATVGAQTEIHAGVGLAAGDGPSDEQVRAWGFEIARIDRVMKMVSAIGCAAVRALAVSEREIPEHHERDAVACLTELAIQTCAIKRNAQAFR